MNHNAIITQDFKLVIPQFEHLNYFIQRAPLPGMHQTAIDTGYAHNRVKIPGETLQYDPLALDFIVDEEMENYRQIQLWMQSMHDKEYPFERTRDLTLHIMTRNKTANIEYTFYGAFPTDIEQLSFDSTLGSVENQTCNVIFQYEWYAMTKGPNIK